MKIGDLMWGIFPIEENKRLFPLFRVCPAVFLGEEKGWIICDKGDARVGWPHWHKEDRQTLIFETKEEADEVINSPKWYHRNADHKEQYQGIYAPYIPLQVSSGFTVQDKDLTEKIAYLDLEFNYVKRKALGSLGLLKDGLE